MSRSLTTKAEAHLFGQCAARYDQDFLALDAGYTERELEDVLVAWMAHFFTEIGEGFAFCRSAIPATGGGAGVLHRPAVLPSRSAPLSLH